MNAGRQLDGIESYRWLDNFYRIRWCEWGDSNSHWVTNWYLKPARLPISPHSHLFRTWHYSRNINPITSYKFEYFYTLTDTSKPIRLISSANPFNTTIDSGANWLASGCKEGLAIVYNMTLCRSVFALMFANKPSKAVCSCSVKPLPSSSSKQICSLVGQHCVASIKLLICDWQLCWALFIKV